jgi:formylglycine-generating enzyme required for sulfatase activity/serine/threonine protein kinase
MPDHEDSLGGETLDGDAKADRAEQSLGDGATMGGDTAAHSLGDQSTFGDANVDDELFDDGMKLEDLSERYTEEGVLGKGGFGEVILATDNRLERKVAIKRIQGKAARSKTAVQRFLTEAKSIAALSHNNVVQIHDYGRSTDGPFLIMECVQGGSLLDLTRKGPIELDKAVNIFSQVCDGLAKAHAAGIIHRDIKPANILMTEDGIPKLTDFGLAKDDTADIGKTMEGAVIGTLDFMPPEQRQGAEFTDHRSDLWSLAATFYQMLTGKSPKVINISSIPPKLQSVVARALEESKEDRFQSAMEMREAILQAHSGKMDTSRSLGEGECPQCATPNPPHGKFCIECSAVLQVQCLECEAEIQIWNRACGDCGAQQTPLVDKALADLKQIHDQAENLLANLEFDTAVEKAAVIVSETDSRLQQFATWHEKFLARTESSRTSEHARLNELLREALTHEQAYDYEAGLQTLKQVAPSLKQTAVSGNEDTADVLTERLTTKQSRLKELKGYVRERIAKREIAGLLPIVNELLTLKPDRADLIKLRDQLASREASIATRNQDTVVKAKQYMSSLRFSEVISALNSIPEIERTDEIKVLIEQAEGYSKKREVASQAIKEAKEFGVFETAITHLSNYLSEIAKSDIQDPRLQQMLDLAQGKASATRRKKNLVRLGIAAACVVVGLITRVVIKINNDAKAAETAIANLDWETALEFDPSNADGLRMQADAKKDAAEKAVILARAPITNTIRMKLKLIPAGTFTMGSPEDELSRGDDEHQHEVMISKSFYMQITEVTQEQWKAVMGTEPWKGKQDLKEGPNYAASYLSWNDAVAYCKTLSEKEGKTYRLPTEAEWEYACRAGTMTEWSFGDDEKVLGDYAWYVENAYHIDEKHAHQVAQKTPNAFGLYDMHGNVWEWCTDYYEKDYYNQSPEKDPKCAATGSSRVLRGGSWWYYKRNTRSAGRNSRPATDFLARFGFRVVRELD